jgi:AGCS family alanine or glycine:cation symporter
MLDTIQRLNAFVNGYVWGWPMIALLMGTGLLLTVLTGVVQVRKLGFSLREVLGKITQRGGGVGSVRPFQAVATALASTVGVGNIAGVATAISIGGPGALFWLWLSGLLGMATKYAEIVVALHYREPDDTGTMRGGAMYVLKKGLGLPWLGGVFALLTSVAAFGIGNMVQANSVADALRATFGLSTTVTGAGLVVLTAVVILGGIKSIARVTEWLVPFMAILYLGGGLIVIVLYAGHLPRVLSLVFDGAFSGSAAVGGFAGSTVMMAMRYGIARGLFSNEAGLGSAPMAHGIADVKHPAEQGVVGVFEVFIDTIVVCSMTAFVILSSGLWTDPAYQASSGDLTAAAMSQTIPFATIIVAISSFLFGFSTLIGWCYYGEKCFEYIFGSAYTRVYRVLFTLLIMVGAVASVPLVWAVGTLLNGFMAFPNLVGLFLLVGVVRKITADYFSGNGKEYSVQNPTTGARV